MTTTSAPPDPNRFPHHVTERLRFGDTDQQGHINNAVFATLFESGRVAFLYDRARGLPPQGTQFVIAQLTIRFMGEMTFPGEVLVASGISRIGKSSVTLAQALFLDGACTATAESVIVLTDAEARRSTPLPEEARALFATLAVEPAPPA